MPENDQDHIRHLQTRYREHLTALNRHSTSRVHFDFTRLYPASDDIAALLAQVDDLRRCIDSFRPLDPTQAQNLDHALTLRYTYDSNRIEGNTLTLQETALILEKGVTIAGKSLREHLEVTGHADAFDYVREIVSGDTEINEWVLLNIHQLVLGGVDRTHAGVYRTIDVGIAGSQHEPPPHYIVPERMVALFRYYNDHKGEHPVVLAANLHQMLVNIHPFVDGNGRTARLLMNLILLREHYPLANISGSSEGRTGYYNALETAHTTGQLALFQRLVATEVKHSAIWYLQNISTIDDPTKGVYFFQRIESYLSE